MKYYIHNLKSNNCYVAESFDKFINYFARQNKGCYQGMGYWGKEIKLNPKIHSFKDYNSGLNHIAMNLKDTEWAGHFASPDYSRKYSSPTERTQREIMVIDELNRIIDPRDYWATIATHKVIDKPWRRPRPPYTYRFDPVPDSSRKRSHRGSYLRKPRTMQERRLSCDLEVKQYINPSRNMKNLVNSWDDIPRNTDHCWKAKKLEKQWMKHIL